MSAPLLTTAAYAEHLGKSVRTVQRLVRDGRLPVVEHDGVVLIPADATPARLTPGDVVTTSATSPVSSTSPALGALGTLEDAARILGTTPGAVRRMADDPDTPFVVRPWGPRGALRVYVAPR